MNHVYQLLGSIVMSMVMVNGVSAGKANDTLVVALNKNIATLDAYYTTQRENIMLGHLISDQLVSLDPDTNEYKPALAKSYKFISDTQIEFVLRLDAKFHDGSPVTVEDIVYSINWGASAEGKTRRAKLINKWFDRVEKVNDSTLHIFTKAAYPLVLRDLALFFQTRKANSYHVDGKPNPSQQATQLIGTGPYKVVDFGVGKGVKLERFEDYYADSPKVRPAIKNIVMRSIPDWGTVTAEMMSKGVDWAFNVPHDIVSDLGSLEVLKIATGLSMRFGYIVFDSSGYTGADKPLTKLKVRQAMNYAVNKQGIVKHLVGGEARVIHSGCVPIQFACPQNVIEYGYDVAKAKQLLAEAGYPDGFELTLWSYREKLIAEAVASDLEKVGVKVNLKYVKYSAYGKVRGQSLMEAAHGTFGSYSTPDAGATSNLYVEGSSLNLIRDTQLSDWFIEAQSIVNQEKRKGLYNKAFKYIADQAFMIPLYQYNLNYLMSKEVNFKAPADGFARLNRIAWK